MLNGALAKKIVKSVLSYTAFPCPFLAKTHPCLFNLLLTYLMSKLHQMYNK